MSGQYEIEKSILAIFDPDYNEGEWRIHPNLEICHRPNGNSKSISVHFTWRNNQYKMFAKCHGCKKAVTAGLMMFLKRRNIIYSAEIVLDYGGEYDKVIINDKWIGDISIVDYDDAGRSIKARAYLQDKYLVYPTFTIEEAKAWLLEQYRRNVLSPV